MVASIFVIQGYDTFRRPERVAPRAEPVVRPLAERIPAIPAKTEDAGAAEGRRGRVIPRAVRRTASGYDGRHASALAPGTDGADDTDVLIMGLRDVSRYRWAVG
jgi:hypothetical protein